MEGEGVEDEGVEVDEWVGEGGKGGDGRGIEENIGSVTTSLSRSSMVPSPSSSVPSPSPSVVTSPVSPSLPSMLTELFSPNVVG